MDDIRIFPKNERELIQTRICRQCIGTEHGIRIHHDDNEKEGKRGTTEGIEQPNQKSIRTLADKEYFKYLEISEVDNIQQTKIKRSEKYLRKTKKTFLKPNSATEISSKK